MRAAGCIIFTGLLVFLYAAAAVAGTTYRWVDADGVTHAAKKPPQGVAAQVVTDPDSPASTEGEEGLSSVAKSEEEKPATLPEADSPPAAEEPTILVELYVTSWCPYCRRAEDWFRHQNIPFTAYDIEQDAAAAQRKAQLHPGRGVPLVMICGQAIPGYSVKAFKEALDECGEDGAEP